MRKLLRDAILASPLLMAEIPAERWVQAGALDDALAHPFAVLRIVDSPITTVKSAQPRFEIWVHDSRGSYLRIDRILRLLRDELEAAPPLEDEYSRIVDIEWSGDSPDLVDDILNTNVRNCRYTLTGRK